MIHQRHRAAFAGGLALAACVILCGPEARAAEPVSFKDKTITMVIPSAAGAGSDVTARLFTRYFSKYLPGAPVSVASNVPSGHGTAAMNYMTQQAKPDGLTVVMGSRSQADPKSYRTPQSRYNPANFVIIGSVGLGDQVMIIRREAVPRLLDRSQPPATMGSVGGVPTLGMSMAVWGVAYLGWNARWVVGYPGTNDLRLALERGEIDMTVFAKSYLADKLTDTGTYKILYQDGLTPNARPSPRADLNAAPRMVDVIPGKITDPQIEKAYDYWRAGLFFKWLALPPKTPDAIRDAYRDAFAKVVADPEFKALAEQSIPGFTVIPAAESEALIGQLAATSDATLDIMDGLMRKQGLNVPSSRTAE